MRKFNKLAAVVAVSLNIAGFASLSGAATSTTTVAVSAIVIDSCIISSQALSFGAYNGISGGMVDVAAMMSPACTLGTAYAISLDAGVGATATHTARQLTGPLGSTLSYGIYTDAARTSVWGNGTSGTVQIFGTGTGGTQPIVMYGRIPGEQTVTVGTYTDIVTVTLTY